MDHIEEQAFQASRFLKALANTPRLMVSCLINARELSVGEIEQHLGLRQPTLSQQLARLREEGLVETRRDGKQIFYRLASEEVRRTIALLDELFCAKGRDAERADGERPVRLTEPAL